MTKEIIFLVEESLEEGYEAKALDHSIYTEAGTLEELKQAIALPDKRAVICVLPQT